MSLWRKLNQGVRALFGSAADRNLTDEVDHYFQQAVAAHAARGLSPKQARNAAQLEVGNTTAVREQVRRSGWEHSVETFWADLRYAARRLRSNPGFTAAAVLSLALGIGGNTAIFSLINATLIRTLAVEKPEELVYVVRPSSSFSYPDFAELRDQNTVFSGLAGWAGITASVGVGNEADLVTGVIVSGNFFEVFGVRAALGRTISVSDDRTPGAHPVAVISDGLWKRRFAERADVVGQDIRFNGHRFTVIGVAPANFGGPVLGVQRDLYVPMMMQGIARPPRGGYSGEMNPDLLQRRSNRWIQLAGRLKPGVSGEQALAQLTAAMKEQDALSPVAPSSGIRAIPQAIVPVNVGDVEQRAQFVSVSRLLLSVVGAVLLIACLNVANLLLARASARRKEIAVRLAIGASRTRLVRQLLTESVLLSTCGGVAGLALAWVALRALRASPPPQGALPIEVNFPIDARVLAFTFALAVITGILFGLVPALRASRPELIPALKDQAGGNNEHVRRFSGRNALVVLQVGVSLVLLISAGLFLRSFQSVQGVEPGFDAARVVSAPLNINLLRYTRTQGRQFYRDLLERVQAIPGVESATLSRWLPFAPGGGSIRSIQIEGQRLVADALRSEGGGAVPSSERPGNVNTVALQYFKTLGIPILKGRDFTAQDDSGSTPVAIVNEVFVKRYFPDGEAIGKRFNFGGTDSPFIEIVGVARTAKVRSLSETTEPVAYVSLLQNHESGVVLQVRSTAGSPLSIIAPVRNVVQALEPNLPIANVRRLEETVATSLYAARVGSRMLLGFGLVALLLAAIGLYGVMSYAVARRTRELGLRMALGAQPSGLLRQILGEGLALVAIGVVGGLAGALFVTRLLTSFLYDVSPTDAATYSLIPLVMLAVALAASIVPALRATRIDPIKALKEE